MDRVDSSTFVAHRSNQLQPHLWALLLHPSKQEMGPIIALSTLHFLAYFTQALPIVDPGLFVISGVKTCGNGEGYCLLGSDCSLDQDFVADKSGHCGGLRGAFTPSANFVCCSASKKHNEIEGDVKSPNSSKYPANVEDDMMTTESLETTTFETEKDYVLLQTDSSKVGEVCDECNATVKFEMAGTPLCFGSLLKDGWVVTSASCAMKIFRVGMVNVVGYFTDDTSYESSIQTIVVHENYRPSASSILLPENNNLGLIQLNDTMRDKCAPCVPKKGQKFAGLVCKTPTNTSSYDVSSFCESELETMQGEGKEEFLTLSCDSPMQSNQLGNEAEMGKPLLCDGYVSGIETSAGVGMTVFTQLSSYSEWLNRNIVSKPKQIFKTT